MTKLKLINFYTVYLPKGILDEVVPVLKDIAEDTTKPCIKAWGLNAERQLPVVKEYNLWSARHDVDRLITNEGWRNLRKWGAEQRSVAISYESHYGKYSRIVQHAKLTAMHRGLTIAKQFATNRIVFRYPPWALPQHLRTLSDIEARTYGFTQLLCVIAGLHDNDNCKTLQASYENVYGRLKKHKTCIFDALDAQRDGDKGADEVASGSILNGDGGLKEWLLSDVGGVSPRARLDEGKARAQGDCRVVWGKELPQSTPFGHRVPMESKM